MRTRYERFDLILKLFEEQRTITAEFVLERCKGSVGLRQIQKDLKHLCLAKRCVELKRQVRTAPKRYRLADITETAHRLDQGLPFNHALAMKLALDHASHVMAPILVEYLEDWRPLIERVATARDPSNAPWFEKVATRPLGLELSLPSIDNAVLTPITDALRQDLKVSFNHRQLGKAATRHVVSPMGLLSRPPRLYLVAQCAAGTVPDWKTYSIARISDVHVLKHRRDLPTRTFKEYIASGKWSFRRSDRTVELELKVSPDLAAQLLETPLPGRRRPEEVAPGDWRVFATLPDTQELETFLLGWGKKVEVVAPAWYRDAIGTVIADMAACYAVLPSVGDQLSHTTTRVAKPAAAQRRRASTMVE